MLASFLALALQLVPLLIKVGEDVAPLVKDALAVYNSGKDPTAEQWQALHDIEARLTGIIDKRAVDAARQPPDDTNPPAAA
jgi:hypothetical protein